MASAEAESKSSLVDKLNVRWALRLLTSSVGRKCVMAVTGLGLSGFLVVHLAGNLFLMSGAEKFNGYAHALHEQEWLPLAEAGLFVLFLAHIYLAISLTKDNVAARRTPYAKKESKIQDKFLYSPPSNWMFISGAVVLGFLILHLVDMKFAARPDVQYLPESDASAPFANTTAVLRTPLTFLGYSLGALFLAFHLSHGFASAFQSLGLNHPKYTPLIRVVSVLFAIVIGAGFFSLALFGFFRMLPLR
jgi:succinate dehydrogenase / fumarate reductase cytochrome b subunit